MLGPLLLSATAITPHPLTERPSQGSAAEPGPGLPHNLHPEGAGGPKPVERITQLPSKLPRAISC